jgi:glucose 1-dehydrogenase
VIQKPAPGHEIEAADFDRILSVNLRGPFPCPRQAIRHFLSRPGVGVILNNSGVHEVLPKPKYLPYSISKGAWKPDYIAGAGVRQPGHPGECGGTGRRGVTHQAWIDNPKAQGEVENHIPMGRAAAADQVASVFAFLASDEASYITGQTMFACGGLTLYPGFREPWSSGE